MGDSTFRAPVAETAKPQAEAPTPQDPARPTQKADYTPIALHEEIEGEPYAAKYFEVGDIWRESDSLAGDLRAIDSYYRTKVQIGELEDSIKNYKQLIEEAEKATNTKNANFNLKVAKIAEFVRFMEKMDKIDAERTRWQ